MNSPQPTPSPPSAIRHDGLLAALRAVLGDARVLTDPLELDFYSQDVHSHGETVLAVLQPDSAADLAKALALIEPAGLAIAIRGGGMSYTGGYLARRRNTVLIDLARLNRIVEINARDMYVTVECGVTWKQLLDALVPVGRRTPYWGPLSGLRSTVGGALSQGSMFLGSGRYGPVAESCIGLDVLRADGRLLRLGSHSNLNGKPFYRQHGPDLMGLFLSDSGALGIKTTATLRLVRHEPAAEHLSLAFADAATMIDAMASIARLELASECFAFDSTLHDLFTKSAGIGSDLKILANVVRSEGIATGLKVAMAGRRFLRNVAYSLHVSVDAADAQETKAKIRAIRAALGEGVQVIEPSIPKLVRVEPFAEVTGMLGPEGERWVNVHGIVPNSAAAPMLAACEAVFEQHAQAMTDLGIVHGYLFGTVGLSGILIEPVLYWPDAREAFHNRVLPAQFLAGIKAFARNPQARAEVLEIREALRLAFLAHGAVSFQLGKFYDYQAALDPSARELLRSIKSVVDPLGRMSPGNLGLAID